MIGCDEINSAVHEQRPKHPRYAAPSQRRRAFSDRSQALGIFFLKQKIVRAGFAGDIDSAQCAHDLEDGFDGAEVHQVQGGSRFGMQA